MIARKKCFFGNLLNVQISNKIIILRESIILRLTCLFFPELINEVELTEPKETALRRVGSVVRVCNLKHLKLCVWTWSWWLLFNDKTIFANHKTASWKNTHHATSPKFILPWLKWVVIRCLKVVCFQKYPDQCINFQRRTMTLTEQSSCISSFADLSWPISLDIL